MHVTRGKPHPDLFLHAAATMDADPARTVVIEDSTAGVLAGVNWDSPAFKAGLTAGETIVAVNGETYDADKLKEAITAASKKDAPLVELLIKDGERYRMVKIDYRDGLRYPRLERVAGAPARLDDILAPRK